MPLVLTQIIADYGCKFYFSKVCIHDRIPFHEFWRHCMNIGEICNRDVIVTTADTSIQEAARQMRTHHVGSLVIVEEKDGVLLPRGIITDRDLVMEVLAEDVAVDQVTVGDVMSYALITARECDGLQETILRMRSRGIRRLPVTDDTGNLVGIMTVDDLLGLYCDELGNLAKLISREAEREQRNRTAV